MIELTVKTLDSRNHSFSVPNDFTVKQLKEFIAESVNLPPDSQRLIYCGRVLQDDKNLSEYNVNGKVIHLVQRAPPGSNSNGTDSNAGRTTTSSNTPRRNHSWRTIFQPSGNSGNAMYLGAMAFPADLMDAQGISMPQPRQCLSQSRLAVAVRMLTKASAVLDNLENPTENVTSTPPEENPTSDVSLDPNANTNLIEEPSSVTRISISSRSTVADALRALITPQSSTSNLQNEASGTTDTETAPTVSIESGTSRNAGQQTSPISEGQSTQNENPNNASGGRVVRTPRTMALAELLDLLATVNRRLQPFLSQYHQLMRDDPVLETSESQQRVFGSVSEIMHYLSHGYHALSDIMCDFSLPPPRYLRCRPVLIQHSAVLQTGIPIPTQFSISSSTHSSSQSAANNTSSSDVPPTASSQTVTSENATTAAAATTTTTSTATTTNTVPPPPRTQPSQERRPLNIPGGFEFFMDVTPGSITIDSLEATVVTNATAATTDANSLGGFTWASPAPPQELMQNLMQVLAHQFMDSGNRSTTQNNSSPTQSSAPGQNSQARGNTATHPTTATQTRSTSRPHVHLTPAMQGIGGSSFDPFLPCNSHHIRSTRRRASHQQTSSANGQPLSQPQSSSTAQSAQSNAAQSGRANTSREVERSAMRGLSDRPGTPDVFPMTLEVERTVNVSSENPLASSGQPEDNLTLSIVTQLMERITGGVAQPASTLAQFLQTLPDHSYIVGENIFMDIFMCLAETFTFTELMQLGLGRTDCLIRARPQLQRLLSERLLNKEPANNRSIRAAVDRFNTEFCPFFSILV
uniref:Large proline-rich protein BAG6 n=1 Tax=Clastoptera arizonana TaxID=38151 RepID=A0A1B6ED57_9HEMI